MWVTTIYYNKAGKQDTADVRVGNKKSTVTIKYLMTVHEQVENMQLIDNRYFRIRQGYPSIKKVRWKNGESYPNRSEAEREDDSGSKSNGRGCKEVQGVHQESKRVRKKLLTKNEATTGVSSAGLEHGNKRITRVCAPILHVSSGMIVDSDTFKRHFTKEKSHIRGTYRRFVDTKSWKSLDKCTCITFCKNKAFVAIAEDGNIVSFMRSPRVRVNNFAVHALANAINNGGEKLDCYALHGAGLAALYSRHGLIPVCKVKFDKEFAEKDWDFENLGEPDIVFFMYCCDDVNRFVELAKGGEYPAYTEYTYIPFVTDFPNWYKASGASCEYDFGAIIRDTVLEKWKTKYHKTYQGKLTEFVKYILKGVD